MGVLSECARGPAPPLPTFRARGSGNGVWRGALIVWRAADPVGRARTPRASEPSDPSSHFALFDPEPDARCVHGPRGGPRPRVERGEVGTLSDGADGSEGFARRPPAAAPPGHLLSVTVVSRALYLV